MSQRASGYARKRRDAYQTPAWVTDAIVPYLRHRTIWEPAAGKGQMVRALRHGGFKVKGTDLNSGVDFLKTRTLRARAIVTNPPFWLAQEFVEHALALTQPDKGFVAMLLRVDFDSAKTRQHIFRGCYAFAAKLVLTRRIVWFERKGAAPSYNHAWFIWDWSYKHPVPARLYYDVRD